MKAGFVRIAVNFIRQAMLKHALDVSSFLFFVPEYQDFVWLTLYQSAQTTVYMQLLSI
jgi:hypothetical protein